jgi:hypothetical protein
MHAAFRQRQRRLFQRNWQGLAATGRSLGRVVTREWALVENIPQPGQRRAASSTVTRASIGLSRSSSSTRVTATPASPSSRVVSLSKPVAFAWMFESQQPESSQAESGRRLETPRPALSGKRNALSGGSP